MRKLLVFLLAFLSPFPAAADVTIPSGTRASVSGQDYTRFNIYRPRSIFFGDSDDHTMEVKAPADLLSDGYTFIFPGADGAANQCLATDGSENTSWITVLRPGLGQIVNADVSATAAIDRSKLAAGNVNEVVINSSGTGGFSSEPQLAISRGGTNSGTPLNNNRVMVSTGGAVVEQSAITVSSAIVTDSSGLPVAGGASATEVGYLSGVTSAIQTQLNGKAATGNYITALTSDVTAAGPGSSAATVNSVGGSTAANVHTAELAANAATDANTVSTIVKRDGSGNFSAGTVTATLTGNATNVSGTVAVAHGGTGQVTASAGFDALSPMSALGDSIYGGASGTNTRLAGNTTSTKKFLTQTGTGTVSAAPGWGTIAAGDVPSLAGSIITSGLVGSTVGGTGVNNSGTLTYGSNNITITTSGTTGVTLPTSGTLSTLAGSEIFTNKTLTSDNIATTLKWNGTSSGTLTMAPPATVTDYTLTWPSAQGGASTVLSNDGSGGLSWASALSNSLNQYNIDVGNSSNVATAANTNLLGDVKASTNSATVTMTIATPAVVTWTGHGLSTYNEVYFTNSGGALPTGVTASTSYWITVVDANSFKLSTTYANAVAGTFVATSGSQSGTHTGFSGGLSVNNNTAFWMTGTQATTMKSNGGSSVASASITMTITKIGNIVSVYVPSYSSNCGTSATEINNVTALPNWAWPTNINAFPWAEVINNAAANSTVVGQARIGTAGVFRFFRDGAGTAYTNSATCGMNEPETFTWIIN